MQNLLGREHGEIISLKGKYTGLPCVDGNTAKLMRSSKLSFLSRLKKIIPELKKKKQRKIKFSFDGKQNTGVHEESCEWWLLQYRSTGKDRPEPTNHNIHNIYTVIIKMYFSIQNDGQR